MDGVSATGGVPRSGVATVTHALAVLVAVLAILVLHVLTLEDAGDSSTAPEPTAVVAVPAAGDVVTPDGPILGAAAQVSPAPLGHGASTPWITASDCALALIALTALLLLALGVLRGADDDPNRPRQRLGGGAIPLPLRLRSRVSLGVIQV